MRVWNRVLSSTAVFVAIAAVSFAGRAPQEGQRGQGARMSAEERAKLAVTAAPITAKAVAKYLKLSEADAKKFSDAYVANVEAYQKKQAEASQSQDREARMALMRENREATQKMLQENLTEEQVKKATPLLGGRGGGLDQSIQILLGAKVEMAKIDKALPTLVEYSIKLSEMRAGARGGDTPREEIAKKTQELTDATAKELGAIVGEEAATTWKNRSQRGGRFGGQRGTGGGRRGGGAGGA